MEPKYLSAIFGALFGLYGLIQYLIASHRYNKFRDKGPRNRRFAETVSALESEVTSAGWICLMCNVLMMLLAMPILK
jgi:hypothetical protein